MKNYSELSESLMQRFYSSLTEKDRRRYAAIEAEKLGHGGISYISRILGCSRTIIYNGLAELEQLADGDIKGIRKAGGGRKSYEESHPNIDEAFLDVLKDNIAGDPMDEAIRWTHLTHREIEERLAEQHQIKVSETVIQQLLAKHGFRRRQAQKNFV